MLFRSERTKCRAISQCDLIYANATRRVQECTRNTVRIASSLGTPIPRTKALDSHSSESGDCECLTRRSALRALNGRLNPVLLLATRSEPLIMFDLCGEEGREPLRDGITQKVESDKRGQHREESVPLECGINQIQSEHSNANPQEVLPFVGQRAAPAMAAGRNEIGRAHV